MNISRIEKVGSIFSRMTGLIRSGLIKWEDRPLWYDIYASFPPNLEPRWDRSPPDDRYIRHIIYPEDKIRAHFYRQFGSIGTISITNVKSKSPADKFIDKFYELHDLNPEMTEDELLRVAGESVTQFEKPVLKLESDFIPLKTIEISPTDEKND